MQYGRQIIYTTEKEVTYDNVADILRNAMKVHEVNATDIQNLLDFEAGEQPNFRKKLYRPEIDNWCVDNIASEVSTFWLSYGWGNPVTFAMRKNADNNNVADGVFELNRFYDIIGNKAKNQEIADYVVKAGVGYTFVDINTDYVDGDSPFTVDVLDPRCAFVVRSLAYLDKRPILGVTYGCDKDGKKTYNCFSKANRYDLDNRYEHLEGSGAANPLGMIPIVEWYRSHDRMGVFERQISEMNNLNLLISDFTNDVDQNTQCVWLTTDIDFATTTVENADGTTSEVVEKPQNGDWVTAYTTPDGKTPNVKPLVVDYDYGGMLNNIMARRALILQKCNVPARNDNSGGSTGVAMSDATGWTQAEAEASRQDQLKDVFKMQEVKLVLKAISKCSGFSQNNPVRKLHYADIEANITRQKTYELTTKVNALCALIAKGFALEDALTIAPMFEDNNQVVVRSGDGVKKYQETQVFKENEQTAEEKRPFPDYSDQISNSPNIDGMRTE